MDKLKMMREVQVMHNSSTVPTVSALTNEVIRAEEVIVPHLQGEARGHMDLRLGQTVEVLLLLDDHDLLWREVLEGEHHSPVEVALSIHRAVVNICLLRLILTSQPPAHKPQSPQLMLPLPRTVGTCIFLHSHIPRSYSIVQCSPQSSKADNVELSVSLYYTYIVHVQCMYSCIPLDVDVAHGISSDYGDLVQYHVLGIVHHHSQHVLVWLAGSDIDGRGQVALLGEYVHPHV